MKHQPFVCLGTLVLMAAACLAQGGAQAVQPGRYVTLVPELADMPAPDWVKAGVRLSFYGAAASTNESRYALVEDPEGPWVDKKTGKHYRDNAQSGTENPTASGEGFTQIDIISVEGKTVVSMAQLYLLIRSSGALYAVGAGMPEVATAANLDDYWVHPKALEKLVGLDMDGLRVVRGPVKVGERTYDAICIESNLGGSYSLNTYDAETGILLKAMSNTAGQFDPVKLPTDITPRQGNTQRTMTVLAGVRQLDAAIAARPVPEWVGKAQAMTYAGTTRAMNPVDGSFLGDYPTQFEATLGVRGAGWCSYRTAMQMSIGGMQNASENVGVAGGVGGFWADPKALAGFKEGAVLDNDPVTGMRVTVGGTGTGPNGQPTIALVTANSTVSTTGIYDLATGTLVQCEVANRATGMTVQLGLQSVR